MDGAAFAGDTFGIGCQFPDTGEPGEGGKAGKGRYGAEASQAPKWTLFNRV